jgi:hypothetical protein
MVRVASRIKTRLKRLSDFMVESVKTAGPLETGD